MPFHVGPVFGVGDELLDLKGFGGAVVLAKRGKSAELVAGCVGEGTACVAEEVYGFEEGGAGRVGEELLGD